MSTINRSITTEQDRVMAIRLMENRALPFTFTITDGSPRSKAQNALAHKWYGEIAEQKGDETAREVRAYCKLTIGVPILRAQNEAFRIRYDEILKPMTYQQKLAIMAEPLDLPVTSLMNTKQLTEYLEGIIRHFGEQGIMLTMPDDLKYQTQGNDDSKTDGAVASPRQEEAGADVSPASSPASSTDEQWLQTAAHMLWSATNVGGDTDANLSVLNAQRLSVADLCPSQCSQGIRDKAGSIYRQCKATVMSEVDKATALKIIAGLAGVTERELTNG